MGDVVKEGVSGAHCEVLEVRRRALVGAIRNFIREVQRRAGRAGFEVRAELRVVRIVVHHDLRETARARDEVAIGIGREQRQVPDMDVLEEDAEHARGLRLDLAPGGQSAIDAVERLAGGDRPVVGHHVLAQEDLVRGMRGVGLVLVDEGRGEVRGPALVVDGRPGQHHEVGLAAFDVERVVRLQRDEHGAALPLGDEVEPVVEELAEEREPRVERRRQALVGRDVRHDQALAGHLEALRGDHGGKGCEILEDGGHLRGVVGIDRGRDGRNGSQPLR